MKKFVKFEFSIYAQNQTGPTDKLQEPLRSMRSPFCTAVGTNITQKQHHSYSPIIFVQSA